MSETQKILKVTGPRLCEMRNSTVVTYPLPVGRSPKTLFFRLHQQGYIGLCDLDFTERSTRSNRQPKVSKTCAQSTTIERESKERIVLRTMANSSHGLKSGVFFAGFYKIKNPRG